MVWAEQRGDDKGDGAGWLETKVRALRDNISRRESFLIDCLLLHSKFFLASGISHLCAFSSFELELTTERNLSIQHTNSNHTMMSAATL